MSEPVVFKLEYTMRADTAGFSARSRRHNGPDQIVCWRCAPPLWHNTLTDAKGLRVTPIFVTDWDAQELTCDCCHERLTAPRAEDFPAA